jgi:hypothetical protein
MKKSWLLFLLIILFFSLRPIKNSGSAFIDNDLLLVESWAATWPVGDFYLRQDHKAVGFKVMEIGDYSRLEYKINYSPDNREKQVIQGSINVSGDKIVRKWFELGWQSGDDWYWDSGMDKIYLEIKLSGNGKDDFFISKQLDF